MLQEHKSALAEAEAKALAAKEAVEVATSEVEQLQIWNGEDAEDIVEAHEAIEREKQELANRKRLAAFYSSWSKAHDRAKSQVDKAAEAAQAAAGTVEQARAGLGKATADAREADFWLAVALSDILPEHGTVLDTATVLKALEGTPARRGHDGQPGIFQRMLSTEIKNRVAFEDQVEHRHGGIEYGKRHYRGTAVKAKLRILADMVKRPEWYLEQVPLADDKNLTRLLQAREGWRMTGDQRKAIADETRRRTAQPEEKARAVHVDDNGRSWVLDSPEWDALQAEVVELYPNLERPEPPELLQQMAPGGGLNPAWLSAHGAKHGPDGAVTLTSAVMQDVEAREAAGLVKPLTPEKRAEALGGHLQHQISKHVLEIDGKTIEV